MRKSDEIWVFTLGLFWLSLIVVFIIDITGVFEADNPGFFEILWISWMMWTVVLGIALAILTRLKIKE